MKNSTKSLSKILPFADRLLPVVAAAVGLMMLLSGLPRESYAQAPNEMTYQGRLQELGVPVNGNREIEIYLCDALTGGFCAMAVPPNQMVTVSSGLFHTTVTIPSGVDLTTGQWWLEIAVENNLMTPRERINSHAYAILASSAMSLLPRPGSDVIEFGYDLRLKNSSMTILAPSGPTPGNVDTHALKIATGTGLPSEILLYVSTNGWVGIGTDQNFDGAEVGLMMGDGKSIVLRQGGALRMDSGGGLGWNRDVFISGSADDGGGVDPQYIQFNVDFSTPLYMSSATFAVGSATPPDDTAVWLQGGAAQQFALRVSSQDATGNMFVIEADGKVGVGTASPFSTITVRGAVGWQEIGAPQDCAFLGGGDKAIIYYDQTTRKLRGCEDNGPFQDLFSAGGDGDWILSGSDMYSGVAGNVGIGAPVPLAKLHIASDTSDLGMADLLTLERTSGATGVIDDGIRMQFLLQASDGTPAEGAAIEAALSDVAFGSTKGYLSFLTADVGILFEQMRITNVGNVGIGLTDPTNALHVSQSDPSTSNPFEVMTIRRMTSGLAAVGIGASMLFEVQSGGGNAATAAAIDGILTDVADAAEDGALVFKTASGGGFPAERMRIDSFGNVGIGTTGPDAAALLEVASTSKGFLPPRMTEPQRDAIISPPAGLIVYNTDKNQLNMSTATAAGSWVVVGPKGTWYKTSTTGRGNTPLTACAAGFHFCKVWELRLEGRTWAGLGDPTPYDGSFVWLNPRGLSTSGNSCLVWTSMSSGNLGVGPRMEISGYVQNPAVGGCNLLRATMCCSD